MMTSSAFSSFYISTSSLFVSYILTSTVSSYWLCLAFFLFFLFLAADY